MKAAAASSSAPLAKLFKARAKARANAAKLAKSAAKPAAVIQILVAPSPSGGGFKPIGPVMRFKAGLIKPAGVPTPAPAPLPAARPKLVSLPVLPPGADWATCRKWNGPAKAPLMV